jgi:hypothetical protein
MALKSFSPDHSTEDAKRSGFFQCPQCGLVWFGRPDIEQCPEGPHGQPVHVVVLCRICDTAVPIERFAEHLVNGKHDLCEN